MACTECHEDEAKGVLKPFGTFNHSTAFIKNHRFYAAGDDRLCASCHKGSFCADCHANELEVKPSVMHGDRPDRQFYHRGDYLTLHQIDGKKAELHTRADAERVLEDLKSRRTFDVTEVKRRERRKNPAAPFTTSTLQQEASKKLSFGSKRTMRVAQGLYEGVDLGDEGAVGLITYMRTDSTRVAESAAIQAGEYLRTLFGDAFVCKTPQLYGDGHASERIAEILVRRGRGGR